MDIDEAAEIEFAADGKLTYTIRHLGGPSIMNDVYQMDGSQITSDDPSTRPRYELDDHSQLLLELTALGSGHDGRPAMLANQTPQWTGTA